MAYTTALVILAFIAGIALGIGVSHAVVGRELTAWSTFLSTRDRSARTRLSCSVPLPHLQALAISINHELDCAEVDANSAIPAEAGARFMTLSGDNNHGVILTWPRAGS